MDFTEKIFAFIAEKAFGTLKVPYGDDIIDLTPPWPRIPMLEALKRRASPTELFNDREKANAWAREKKLDIPRPASLAKILDEIFKENVEPGLMQPTFITDYPVELSPLAKRKTDNPEFVERFELFITPREIANAFSELNDPADQRERFLRTGRGKEDRETKRRTGWTRIISGRLNTACLRQPGKA